MKEVGNAISRRTLLKACGGGAGLILLPELGCSSSVPSFLSGRAELYRQNPRHATLEWFKSAKFGLFMHYGLYSLLGNGEWVMYYRNIPVAEYARLKDRFTAEKFDPDAITDLALEAGMKYVNITARHHDSFVCSAPPRPTSAA